MTHYDDSKDNYVSFEKLGHHRLGNGRTRADVAQFMRRQKRMEKLRQGRIDKQIAMSKPVNHRRRARKFMLRCIPKPTPKPIGPKYNGTLRSIGEILKFYPRRET